MLNESDVKKLNEEKSELEASKQRYESDKKRLLDQNKDKISERNSYQKKVSSFGGLTILGIAVAVAGCLFIDAIVGKIALIAVGLIIVIACLILKSKNKKVVRELSTELSSCDSKEKEYNSEISKINGRLNEINKSLQEYEKDIKRMEKYNALEEEYKEYTEGHICIYCAESSSLDNNFYETSNFYNDVNEVIVYIDGIECGSVKYPFEAFAVTPGSHIVKIEAYHRIGGKNGMDFEIVSKAKQVKVSDSSSAYLFYNWNFNMKLQNTLFLRTFDNLFDFLKHIHEI